MNSPQLVHRNPLKMTSPACPCKSTTCAMTISPPHRAQASCLVGWEKTDASLGFPVVPMEFLDTDEAAISHSSVLNRPFPFTPSRNGHAHGLRQSGHQCTSQESHCEQKDKAHIHAALLSPVNNGNCPQQSFPFAKETGPSIPRGPVCLSGRRRAEFGVT